jgi:hypothetical protein
VWLWGACAAAAPPCRAQPRAPRPARPSRRPAAASRRRRLRRAPARAGSLVIWVCPCEAQDDTVLQQRLELQQQGLHLQWCADKRAHTSALKA